MSLTEQIKNMGKEIGLDIIRITNAETFPQTENSIIKSIKKGYIPGSEYRNNKDISLNSEEINFNKISKRCNPKNILKKGKIYYQCCTILFNRRRS